MFAKIALEDPTMSQLVLSQRPAQYYIEDYLNSLFHLNSMITYMQTDKKWTNKKMFCFKITAIEASWIFPLEFLTKPLQKYLYSPWTTCTCF